MSSEQQSLPRQFFEELKRRRVIRVATLYVIALWPIIQIVDILSPALGLPPITMRYLLIVFVGGLPIALILSWLYDLNKGGVVRTTDVEAQRGHALIGRSAEITVISVLVIAILVLFYLQSTLEIVGQSEPDPVPTAIRPPPGETDVHTIAVLPFVSFSPASEDELFSDGLTEELLNVLSQIKYLRVIARTTSFAYKGVSRNVQEIGQELNVSSILEGSVRRNDVENTIRVTAQLIDISTGTHLWSDTFDREFRDIFKIQDEIAAAVVAQLDLTLGDDESLRITARKSASPEAMVAYAMGRTALATRTEQSLRDAERYLSQAIEADPGYAAAYAELANAYSLQADLRPAQSRQYLELAQAEVDKALAIDPENGSAWSAQGLVYMMQSKVDVALEDDARMALARAIDLNPSLAMANMWYGNLQHDPAEMQRYHARAFDLDPRSPVAGYNLANDYLAAGREGEAMEVFSKIVAADPNYPGAYRLIGQMNEFRGRLGEAIRNYERVYAMQPGYEVAEDIAELWVDIGDFRQADEWLARAEDNLPDEHLAGLRWIRIGSYVARGDRAAAEALMKPLLDSRSTNLDALLEKSVAGYFLGEYQISADAYEQALTLDPDRHAFGWMNRSEVDVQMAYIYRQLGRDDDANRLLDTLEKQMKSKVESMARVDPDHWFVIAQLNAIRGDDNKALISLQRAVDEGWRQHWRPYVEPNLASLIGDPAFTAMMQGLATRMDLMREQIAFDAEFDEAWKI